MLCKSLEPALTSLYFVGETAANVQTLMKTQHIRQKQSSCVLKGEHVV